MEARLRQPRLPAPNAAALRRRDVRVVALLVAIACMGMGDLYMTLVFLTNGGMIESNPIARAVIMHNSPAALAVWKIATMGLAIGILSYARRRWFAEGAAWLCFLVMAWLTIHWTTYINETTHYTALLASARQSPELVSVIGGDWVELGD